jgi:hypothetical protein
LGDAPCFVVTHTPPAGSDPVFTFVTDGIQGALAKAQAVCAAQVGRPVQPVTSVPAWPCPGPSCTKSCARACRCGDPVGPLRERFAGFAAPVPGLLDQLVDLARVHVASIEQVAEERWGRGAVVLVGDAAHGMSPNMAQGGALAFEDALVLAGFLRDAATVADAVAVFVARRSRRTGWVRTQTHRRDRTRDLPPVLRDLTLRAFGRRIFQSNYRPLLEPI